MKFWLNRASQYEKWQEVEITTLEDLLSLVREQSASVIIEAPVTNCECWECKKDSNADMTHHKEWTLMVYDNYIE